MNCRPNSVRLFHMFLLAGTVAAITLTGCKLDSIFKSKVTSDVATSLDDEANRIQAHAQSPNWLTSVEVAMNTAKNQDKLVMAVFTGTDWCPFCVKLEKEVFANSEFRDWAHQNVVPLFLDFPKKKKLNRTLQAQNDSMRARYQEHIGGYPTVLFLDSNGEVVAKMGYAKGGPAHWIAKAENRLNWK